MNYSQREDYLKNLGIIHHIIPDVMGDKISEQDGIDLTSMYYKFNGVLSELSSDFKADVEGNSVKITLDMIDAMEFLKLSLEYGDRLVKLYLQYYE